MALNGMNLDEIIQNGLALVREDPQHDLRAGFRCLFFSFMDEADAVSRSSVGKERRVKLAAIGVRKVLPIWESAFVGDRTPHEALQLAEAVLTGKQSVGAAERESGKMWVHCDDLAWGNEGKMDAVMVGYAAIQAVREALSPEHFGCEGMRSDSSDLDVDPYDEDSAFCASVAYCGGPPWENRSDSRKRAEFWTWWLTTAIPLALE